MLCKFDNGWKTFKSGHNFFLWTFSNVKSFKNGKSKQSISFQEKNLSLGKLNETMRRKNVKSMIQSTQCKLNDGLDRCISSLIADAHMGLNFWLSIWTLAEHKKKIEILNLQCKLKSPCVHLSCIIYYCRLFYLS